MSDKFPGQSDEQKNAADPAVEAQKSAHNPARRKFAKAGVVIAPVVLSVSARPAFANMCSISGAGSPGSNAEQLTCKGDSHGYWKQHPEAWPGLTPGTENSGRGIRSSCKKYQNDGTLFDDVFEAGTAKLLPGLKKAYAHPGGRVSETAGGDRKRNCSSMDFDYLVEVDSGETPINGEGISLMQVLHLQGSAGTGATVPLAFQFVAAYLNALKYGAAFGYSAAQLLIVYANAVATMPTFPTGISDLNGLQNALDSMNTRL